MSEQAPAPRQAEHAPEGTVEVTLRHQGVETKIIGSPEGAVRELLAYIARVYPSVQLVSKLILTQDETEFMQACTDNLASSKEGLAILRDVTGLRDKELIMLHLAGARLLH